MVSAWLYVYFVFNLWTYSRCNPIQPGPQDATIYSELSCPNGTGTSPATSGAFSRFKDAEKHIVYFFLATSLILARFE